MELNIQLKQKAEKMKSFNMREAFEKDENRFQKFHAIFNDFLLDYSKNLIDDEVMTLLLDWAKKEKLADAINAMFSGEKINTTEGRAVLHTALRASADKEIYVDGKNVVPDVQAVLEKMHKFSDAVRTGAWRGTTGKEITDVVNIGIGGSDLGPSMATDALTV